MGAHEIKLGTQFSEFKWEWHADRTVTQVTQMTTGPPLSTAGGGKVFIKGQIVNIFCFLGHRVYHRHSAVKAATGMWKWRDIAVLQYVLFIDTEIWILYIFHKSQNIILPLILFKPNYLKNVKPIFSLQAIPKLVGGWTGLPARNLTAGLQHQVPLRCLLDSGVILLPHALSIPTF